MSEGNEVAPRTPSDLEPESTLLASGVVVSRDTIEHAVKMIALSCCRGRRQLGLVEELLDSGRIPKNLKTIPVFSHAPGSGTAVAFGAVSLGTDSFANLKARMVKAGFTFVFISNAYDGNVLRRGDMRELGYMRVYWGVTEGMSVIEQR